MVSSPSPPAAPDPKATAQAQGAMNRDTAITQNLVNSTNQITPQGTLTYDQTGTRGFTDSDGKWVEVPTLTATTTYSPEQQRLYDLGLQTQTNLGNIGVEQSDKIRGILNQPFEFDAAIDNKLAQFQRGLLDPQWSDQKNALESSLINKGIRPGTELYDREMRNFSTQRQSAYDQAYVDAYGKAAQTALTERNQPINEISALMSGSQVSQPNFGQTPTSGVAPTDYIGAVNTKYQADLAAYNSEVQSNNAMMSGLFGLGSAALGGWMRSDITSKENVDVVGERPDSLHVIDFDYKPESGVDDGRRHRGLVAQEVAQVYPNAVAKDASGKMNVDYSRVPGGLIYLGMSAKKKAA